MIDYYAQITLQGILEAFPISSSMHLKTLNIANVEILHFGTGIAFFLYTIDYFSQYIKKPFSKKTIKFTFKIFLLTLPTVIVGLLFKKQPQIISIDIINIICSIVMLMVNINTPAEREFKSLKIKEIVAIGLLMSLSLAPGASRFGIAFTTLRLFHLTHQESFLYAIITGIPVTIGAALLSMSHIQTDLSVILASLFAGVLTYQTLKITKKLLKYWNIFSIYRIIFSLTHVFLNTKQKHNLIMYITMILCLLFGIKPKLNSNTNAKNTVKIINKKH